MTDIVVKTRAEFASEEDYRRYVEEALRCHGAQVECLPKGSWSTIANPRFDWSKWDYRVKEVPDSIDWGAVSAEYKWLARNPSGRAFLYPCEPKWSERWSVWDVPARVVVGAAEAFSSYRRGTTPASQSLVKRPEA